MPNDSFSPAEDPEKIRQEAHSAATSMARLLSDTFYKSDDLLQKIPDTAPAKAELRAIRDNLFIQKNKAESIVQKATSTAVPPEAEAAPAAPAAPATPTSSMASQRTASVPSVAAETVYDAFQKGREAKAGSLATDGKVVTFGGTPIMKNEGGRVKASWGGKPTMAIAASVNSLAMLAGLADRPFTLQDGAPTVLGQKVGEKDWADLGAMPGGPAEVKTASIPRLLQRK